MSSFLHNNKHRRHAAICFTRDGAPRIDVDETDYGYYYVSTRKMERSGNYVRVYQYVMPFQQMRAAASRRWRLGRERQRAALRRPYLGADR